METAAASTKTNSSAFVRSFIRSCLNYNRAESSTRASSLEIDRRCHHFELDRWEASINDDDGLFPNEASVVRPTKRCKQEEIANYNNSPSNFGGSGGGSVGEEYRLSHSFVASFGRPYHISSSQSRRSSDHSSP